MNDNEEKFDKKEGDSDNSIPYDLSYDPIDEDGEVDLKAKIADIRKKLRESERAKAEYLEGWQRSKADFINARKEDERAKLEFVKFAEERLLLKLLPSLESFSMAVEGAKGNDSLPADWKTGLEYIHQQMMQSLKESGLEEIKPAPGSQFDPRFHEAANIEEVKNAEEDQKIAKLLQVGFILGGKVLKPAAVIVKNFINK